MGYQQLQLQKEEKKASLSKDMQDMKKVFLELKSEQAVAESEGKTHLEGAKKIWEILHHNCKLAELVEKNDYITNDGIIKREFFELDKKSWNLNSLKRKEDKLKTLLNRQKQESNTGLDSLPVLEERRSRAKASYVDLQIESKSAEYRCNQLEKGVKDEKDVLTN